MLKYIGILTVLIAAATPAIDYRRSSERRLSELEYFCRLARGIEERLRYMRPIGEYIRTSDVSSVGYAISAGEELLSGADKVVKRLSLPDNVKERLSGYFSSLGEDTAERELSRIEELSAFLLKERADERERFTGGLRLRCAVCAAVGLSLVILLI